MNAVEDLKLIDIYIRMNNNTGKSEDTAKLKNLSNLGISKTEEKLKLKNFNFCWWRDPPYKNDDFRRRIQLS